MNKKLALFLKIIYWIFTFGLGLLLAFALPGILTQVTIAQNLNTYLLEGKYANAMGLVGGYYDSNYIYQETFDDECGVVLFSSSTLFEVVNEEEKTITYELRSVYSGFLYNANDKYLVDMLTDNKTKIKVIGNDKTIEIDILNYDSNKDDIFDSISTLNEGVYVYFEVDYSEIQKIDSIEFIDREGRIYQKIDLSSVDYYGQAYSFFNAVSVFENEYNANPESKNLQALEDEILANQNYKKSDHTAEYKKGSQRATTAVILYFIWIYILGDFIAGPRYIWKFFKWIYRKIRRIKEEEPVKEEVYGSDYYSQLTFKLIVPDGCDINVSINYHNENYNIEMILTKDKDYTLTQRVHAGEYVNAWLECPGYETLNLPKKLTVRGFKMTVEVILNKIEEINNKEDIRMEEDNENKN